jgi:predicted DNA-binding transcriptional regulator AlpA
MSQIETLSLKDLANILKRSTETIKADIKRKPSTVPRPFKLPGSNRWLWNKGEVEKWIEKNRTGPDYLDPEPQDDRPLEPLPDYDDGEWGDEE